ncbi:Cof-type HAD-IIB family hydrolase [Clostridium swellfunianum]|uniref:Cof-type HAD-IIB family hydrolase n=1 Tax=Clostridium swellfunianum TaxID=1367462 RepID=UPI002030DB28|nr:Cof-type HAD-IIB family hydrolase [Clostridium swellfunianum]MCM0650852.1 Cof-type HAD-IIB family hydrolase [Clostridium swellfunianum]
MIQAIFFDIDGTLISSKLKTCSASTRKALAKLREKGVYTFVATGRHILEIEKEHLIDGLYFDAYITLNGQYCFNSKEVIYQNEINKEDIKNLIKQIDESPYPCMFVEKDNMYINIINQRVIEVQKSIYSSLPPIMDIHRALENPVYQIIPYIDSKQAELYPLSVLKHCKSIRWNPYAIDIIPASGSKMEGIKKLLEYYKIPPENTMAFGDGENDIEMLDCVAIGIAMGNAGEKVKKVADYITDSVENDGVAQALEYFNLV